jgi:hypothetical protein
MTPLYYLAVAGMVVGAFLIGVYIGARYCQVRA